MTQALQPGVPRRRRALFGLLDADGWGWAFVKAFFWFIVIIFLLGYIPDRAYYFTVNQTLDLGILAWSPVNLCPPTNKNLPCPPPFGAVVPWEESPQHILLPSPPADKSPSAGATSVPPVRASCRSSDCWRSFPVCHCPSWPVDRLGVRTNVVFVGAPLSSTPPDT